MERTGISLDARVVNGNVQMSISLHCRIHHLFCMLLRGQIQIQENGCASFCPDSIEYTLSLLLQPVSQHQLRSFLRRPDGCGLTDTPGRASQNDYLIFKTVGIKLFHV